MRRALQSLACAVLLLAGGARGHDARRLLYSDQLAFEAAGEPIVNVGLMDGQTAVRVRAETGLVVALGGPARSELHLPAGTLLAVSLATAKPGETRYRVVLDGFPGADLGALAKARARWRAKGVQFEEVQLGGLVGYPGRLLDARRTLLVEAGRHATRAAAEARGRELARTLLLEEGLGVLPEPVAQPTGRLVARVEALGLELQADDLVRLLPVEAGVLEVLDVEPEEGGARRTHEDRRYRGEIVIVVDPSGHLAVVNRVPAEQMLLGLVPAETYPDAPAAALEAQAITARGELLAKLGVRHRGDPYHVCSTQHCQVYAGVGREAPGPTRAVLATRGQMLLDGGGALVDAVYSASCGGHTEDNDLVWGGTPRQTLRGHPDGSAPPWPAGTVPDDEAVAAFLREPGAASCAATEAGRRSYRWTRALGDEEIDGLVTPRYPVGPLAQIQVVQRGVSGRALRLRLVGRDGEAEVQGELAIRRLFGHLPSSLFVVDHRERRWNFVGGGHGHGVGMCQHGAIGLARTGKRAGEILEHYYPSARIERVY